jgi:hypothetical protein
MSFRLHRLAVAEIDQEVDYYESRLTGLGTKREDELDHAFSMIFSPRSQDGCGSCSRESLRQPYSSGKTWGATAATIAS